jgi:hypothetical protein
MSSDLFNIPLPGSKETSTTYDIVIVIDSYKTFFQVMCDRATYKGYKSVGPLNKGEEDAFSCTVPAPAQDSDPAVVDVLAIETEPGYNITVLIYSVNVSQIRHSMFQAIPVDKLGMEYNIIGQSDMRSQIAIASVTEGGVVVTEVDICVPDQSRSILQAEIGLQQYWREGVIHVSMGDQATFEFSCDCDLSGTRIVASERISVVVKKWSNAVEWEIQQAIPVRR